MRHLAAAVAHAGMTPGLWMVPSIALPQSQIVRNRPDLFPRDRDGELAVTGYNWETGYHALDLTFPAARDHLCEMITRISTEWGYRYLELDRPPAAGPRVAGAAEVRVSRRTPCPGARRQRRRGHRGSLV